MSRSTILIILGVLVGIAPFSGLPLSVLEFVLPILGLMLAGLGIMERRPGKHRMPPVQVKPTYGSPEE